MAKKYLEAELILKNLQIENLTVLDELHGNTKLFETLKRLLTDLMYQDEGKVINLAGGCKSADEAVEKMVKQNFYKGRINMLVLLHALLLNAGKEINRREKKV
jgi:hypothetical protein